MAQGLERLADMFARCRSEQRGALMPFLVGGHPRPGLTGDLIRAADRAGADALEIGFPFSDPIADGPVVAAAMHEALQAGATPLGVLEEVAAVRGSTDAALIAMVSVSIVSRLGGPGSFVPRAVEAGFDGFIFPDMTVEEAEMHAKVCDEHGVGCSLLIAPTTPAARVRQIAAVTRGFIYLLARAGITGERDEAPDIRARVDEIRTITDLPIAVGFGISNAQHVRAVVEHADAAIVGSALVRRIGAEPDDAAGAVERFVGELRSGCGRAGN
jgi:tryptophan synthase alpha chain